MPIFIIKIDEKINRILSQIRLDVQTWEHAHRADLKKENCAR